MFPTILAMLIMLKCVIMDNFRHGNTIMNNVRHMITMFSKNIKYVYLWGRRRGFSQLFSSVSMGQLANIWQNPSSSQTRITKNTPLKLKKYKNKNILYLYFNRLKQNDRLYTQYKIMNDLYNHHIFYTLHWNISSVAVFL